MTTLKWIPVSAVVGTVLQPRLQEDRGLDSLTESILQGGLDTPIIALRDPRTTTKDKARAKANKKTKLAPDQLYLMRSGHRRRAALLTLVKRGVAELPAGFARIEGGEAHVQAVIVDNVTDEEAAIAALIDSKQLNVRPSVHGDQVTIKVDGTRAMREACLAIA